MYMCLTVCACVCLCLCVVQEDWGYSKEEEADDKALVFDTGEL